MPSMTDSPIIYTYTDEAPALATHSFLPVIEAFAGACGVGIEDPGHLACSQDPGPVERHPRRGSARQRRTERAGRVGQDAAGQHHQAAQHLGLGATAEGCHQRTPVTRLRHPGLPRRCNDGCGSRCRRALRRCDGFGRQPGAAGGQFRPSCPGSRQGVRPQQPPHHGGVVSRTPSLPRGHHERAATSATTSSRSPSGKSRNCRSVLSATTARPRS